MAHNSLIRTPGPSGWNLNTAVQPTEWAAIDLAQFQSVNGDLGGTWAPATPIIIGGAGIQPPTHTRTRSQSIADYNAAGQLVGLASSSTTKTAPSFSPQPPLNWGYATPLGFVSSLLGATQYSLIVVPLNNVLDHGTTLAFATLDYVTGTHANLPASLPFFGIFCAPAVLPTTAISNPGPLTFARSLLSTYWATDTAASAAAYSGSSRSVLWTPDQNMTIDRTQYNYFAVVADENGANAVAGNLYSAIVVSLSNVTTFGN